MGEAKRRKKLDPNYGKIPVPSDDLVKNWWSHKELAFFREITSGGEGIAYDWGDNDSFQLARTSTQQIESKIRQRYSQMGRGFVSLIPSEVMLAITNKPTKGNIDWNYWSYQELISVNSHSALLGSIKKLKPFLLWAINNYQPETEAILLLCGFPMSIEKAAKGTTPLELATNRFYGVLRYQFQTNKIS